MIRIFSASFRQHNQAPASSEPGQQLSLLSWERQWQGQGIYLAPIPAAWRAASLTLPNPDLPSTVLEAEIPLLAPSLHQSQSIREQSGGLQSARGNVGPATHTGLVTDMENAARVWLCSHLSSFPPGLLRLQPQYERQE